MSGQLPKPSLLSEKSRVKAVAAKISAARELARRLAEEKQAAVAAARADADSDRLKRSTEEAAAAAAAQVRWWVYVCVRSSQRATEASCIVHLPTYLCSPSSNHLYHLPPFAHTHTITITTRLRVLMP